MQPNAKVMQTIAHRVEARAVAADADGLRALILAAERGRELAAAALAEITGDEVEVPSALAEREAEVREDALDLARRRVNLYGEVRQQVEAKIAAEKPGVLADLAAEHDAERPDPEEIRKQRAEARIVAEMERADTSKLYAAILEQGGIRPSTADLAEEYRAIPPSYRRPDGMAGDEMAEHLSVHMPELGIRDERDLLAFFADRRRRAYHKRAA